MNSETISKEDLKNGLQDITFKELEDIAKQVTEHSIGNISVDFAIEGRESNFPILKMCQKCALLCKKHGASGLMSFRCFDFAKEKK